MRIFLLSLSSSNHVTLTKELCQRGIEVAYITGSKASFHTLKQEKNNEFSETIFHDTFDAISAIPHEKIDTTHFIPPGKDLLNTLSECESQVLSMMNGLDIDGMPFVKRKHYYYEYVKYWFNVLKQFQPDAIIFLDIPHVPHNFVIYTLAKLLGIRTIVSRAVHMPGRLIFMEDFQNYDEIIQGLEKLKNVTITVDDLSADFQEFYKKQTSPSVDSTPFYMKKEYIKKSSRGSRLFPTFGSIIKNIISLRVFSSTYYYVQSLIASRRYASLDGYYQSGFDLKMKTRKWKQNNQKYKDEYYKLQSTHIDLKKKFVYIPLHNQPECSTSAIGDVFVDQILMIDLVAQSIPDDWVVYVKENPIQWTTARANFGRYVGYYKQIQKIPKVVLVPTNISTYDLVNNSQAVATITGTAGLEAILRSKPVLLFGYIWYMYADGIFRVSNLTTCQKAIEKIISGFVPDSSQVLKLLKVMDDLTVRGFPNSRYQMVANVTPEENIRNITDAFYHYLTHSTRHS